MPQKWARPQSLGEIFNASLDHTLRVLKVVIYGRDNSNAVPIKVDSSGVIATEKEGAGAVGDGIATVTSAGTRVQLSAQACRKVFIQAYESNAGTLVVGGVTVVAAVATRQGFALYPSQGDWFNVNNMNLLYIDSTEAGDKINFYYEN